MLVTGRFYVLIFFLVFGNKMGLLFSHSEHNKMSSLCKYVLVSTKGGSMLSEINIPVSYHKCSMYEIGHWMSVLKKAMCN